MKYYVVYFVHDVLIDPLRDVLDTGIMFEVNQDLLVENVRVVCWDISDVIRSITNTLFKFLKTSTNCPKHYLSVKVYSLFFILINTK